MFFRYLFPLPDQSFQVAVNLLQVWKDTLWPLRCVCLPRCVGSLTCHPLCPIFADTGVGACSHFPPHGSCLGHFDALYFHHCYFPDILQSPFIFLHWLESLGVFKSPGERSTFLWLISSLLWPFHRRGSESSWDPPKVEHLVRGGAASELQVPFHVLPRPSGPQADARFAQDQHCAGRRYDEIVRLC